MRDRNPQQFGHAQSRIVGQRQQRRVAQARGIAVAGREQRGQRKAAPGVCFAFFVAPPRVELADRFDTGAVPQWSRLALGRADPLAVTDHRIADHRLPGRW